MDVERAAADVLLGASLRQLAAEHRARLIAAAGLAPDRVTPATFRDETAGFLRRLARHLGDHHAGEPRIGQALREWIAESDHYEAWDALLSGFAVDGRDALVRRGRVLFPGSLTAHWTDS